MLKLSQFVKMQFSFFEYIYAKISTCINVDMSKYPACIWRRNKCCENYNYLCTTLLIPLFFELFFYMSTCLYLRYNFVSSMFNLMEPWFCNFVKCWTRYPVSKIKKNRKIIACHFASAYNIGSVNSSGLNRYDSGVIQKGEYNIWIKCAQIVIFLYFSLTKTHCKMSLFECQIDKVSFWSIAFKCIAPDYYFVAAQEHTCLSYFNVKVNL